MFLNAHYKLAMLAAFFAGLLLPLAFAPFEWALLAIPLLGILFYLCQQSTPRQAWWRGWAFGTGMFLSGTYWVYISMHDFGAVPAIFSVLLTVLFALFLGLFSAMAAWLSVRFFPGVDRLRLLLVFPTIWVLLEWVRSWFFTGFPWLNLGVSQSGSPLAGYASIIGEFGISWLLAFTSAGLVFLLQSGMKSRITLILLITSFWWGGYHLKQYEWTQPVGEPFSVAMVQGNVDQNIKWDPDHRVKIITSYLELSRSHWDADLMIWPETAISAFYHHVPEVVDTLEQLAREQKTDMLVGIPYRNLDTRDYYNSVLSLGGERQFYHKRHLVPFGEFIPFQDLISDVLDFMGLPMSSFSQGLALQPPLKAGGYLAGLTVCYEIIFNSEVIQSLPKANYLVNVSNNTWFGDSSMPFQQLQMAQLRALETQRYVLSATNNGVSAVVDHEGKIIARSPQFQTHVLRANVQARQGATPFVGYGNIPIISFLFIAAIFAVCANRHYLARSS